MTWPAKYIQFMTDKSDGELEMWGTNGIGCKISGDPLIAEPWFNNINLGVDDTDLAVFADINMLQQDFKDAIWGLNDYGVISDIYCLYLEPTKKHKLQKHCDIKNCIYDLVAALQANYLQDIQEFHQVAHSQLPLEELPNHYFPEGHHKYICNSNSSCTNSIHTSKIIAIDPSNSSASSNSIIQGNLSHYGLVWHVHVQKNVSKFCKV